ncbi:sialate O-acetylesterase [Oleiharenicola lentus]|uniref:sialate O-acetylesterase n=1 Tax=Oleiharenicola lentus TaxID=2508720 RepID=UPI003F6727D8
MKLPLNLIASLAGLHFAAALTAAVQLASPFTDHMVLQRDLPVPVWGRADVGEKVTVEFDGQKLTATTNADGKWRIDLRKLKTSATGREFKVSGSATPTPLVLKDVLVGEVWLASGQSNMVFTLSKSRYRWAGVVDEEKEIAAANYPLIRMFTAAEQKSYTPQERVEGKWEVCTPENTPAWSAVGYFFARELQREIKVPVGIVTVAYGASTAHAWIRREAMLAEPELKAVLERFDEQVRGHVAPTEAEIEDWKRAVELAKAEKKRAPARPGEDPVKNQRNPAVMFNGMLAPLVPYAVRGVLWYQGESITAPRELFPRWNELLIKDWRKLWGRELPFYFAQLAALDNASNSPEVRAWQSEALKIPNTGMAVTIDIGEKKDVHPHHKAPLGERFARLALAHNYGRAVEFSGPVWAGSVVDESAIRLSFDHADEGLVAKDGPLRGFEIAGADEKYFPANAHIEGNVVMVSSPEVPEPKTARYAWANWPEGANLFNQAELPAAPFMTK